jgi:hypothetical protein
VPELRRFTDDAQRSLLNLARTTARSVTKGIPGQPDMKLGVGLRGAVLYGGIAIGTAATEKPARQEMATAISVEPLDPFFVGSYPADRFPASNRSPA